MVAYNVRALVLLMFLIENIENYLLLSQELMLILFWSHQLHLHYINMFVVVTVEAAAVLELNHEDLVRQMLDDLEIWKLFDELFQKLARIRLHEDVLRNLDLLFLDDVGLHFGCACFPQRGLIEK